MLQLFSCVQYCSCRQTPLVIALWSALFFMHLVPWAHMIRVRMMNWNQRSLKTNQSTSRFWNISSNLIPYNLSIENSTFRYLHYVLFYKKTARPSWRRCYSFYLKGIKAIQKEEKSASADHTIFAVSWGRVLGREQVVLSCCCMLGCWNTRWNTSLVALP